ncbi:family 1 glycosylhydrolase, partial [uncultured Mobiluncus sp.]
HDPRRIDYLARHFRAVAAARHAGVNVAGYYVWSLLDNFEWADGETQRFGLIYTDFATADKTRIPKDSYYWYRDLIAQVRQQ